MKTHTDEVTVSGELENEYFKSKYTATHTYQYDRASDLWTWLDSSEWEQERNLVDFSDNSPIKGSAGDRYDYTIYGEKTQTIPVRFSGPDGLAVDLLFEDGYIDPLTKWNGITVWLLMPA